MNEEELFCKLFPEYAVNGKPLSPYFDLFESGYEQSEKQLAELEAQIEKMKCCGNCQKLRCRFDSKTNINILYCSDFDMKQIEVGFQMCCCKWEIKEK